MAKVQHCVDLHPKTVQKIAEDFVMISRPTRKFTVKRNSHVETVQLDAAIVKYLRYLKIPASRVEVISPLEIIIHN